MQLFKLRLVGKSPSLESLVPTLLGEDENSFSIKFAMVKLTISYNSFYFAQLNIMYFPLAL